MIGANSLVILDFFLVTLRRCDANGHIFFYVRVRMSDSDDDTSASSRESKGKFLYGKYSTWTTLNGSFRQEPTHRTHMSTIYSVVIERDCTHNRVRGVTHG